MRLISMVAKEIHSIIVGDFAGKDLVLVTSRASKHCHRKK